MDAGQRHNGGSLGSESRDNLLITAIAVTIFPSTLKASNPPTMHRGPGDTCTHSRLCCERGTPSFEKLNLSIQAIGRPDLCSGGKHYFFFQGSKQACPLLWRRYYLYLQGYSLYKYLCKDNQKQGEWGSLLASHAETQETQEVFSPNREES